MIRVYVLGMAVLSGLCISPLSPAADSGASTIPLAGQWQFEIDRQAVGVEQGWAARELAETVRLPGSLQEQGYGDEVTVDTPWIGGIVDRSWFTEPQYEPYRQPGNIKVPFWLQPDKHYVGIAWYSRELTIPETWKGRRITLDLERCHWETRVWLDGREIGSANSLATPHVYDLTVRATPGKHRLSIRVDNRILIGVGINAHSVSDHTQSNWNGLVGDLALRATSPVWIDDVQVYPDLHARKARVVAALGNATGAAAKGTLTLEASCGDHRVASEPLDVQVDSSGGKVEAVVPMGDGMKLWDEFTPNVYTLQATLQTSAGRDLRETAFGMREIGRDGTQFTVNGRRIFLRGTLECCIFPLTGYPPTDVEAWRRIYAVLKSHGLNHVRFHSWCPPKAAFTAADEAGIYLYVECPAWANQGSSVGDGQPIDQFIYDEGDRILREYGNHPSLCLMSYGNEPAGKNQNQYLGKLVEYWKAKDPRRLYTSGAGWPIIPENQWHSTPAPRIQQWGQGLKSRINALPPETVTDYRDFVARQQVPVVAHEIGQWCVYPNFDEMKKYTGVLKPKNFEIFRDSLAANHMLDQARDFLIASGKLQTLCYKEEIESALRTPGFGGFELLDLHDFPGQGTALVGVLDPFWDGKGYVAPDEFRRFCAETVPLARMAKRIWTADETLEARVEVAHYGPATLEPARPVWTLTDSAGKPVAAGRLEEKKIATGTLEFLGTIGAPLKDVREAQKLVLTVALEGTPYANDWDVWVYPAKQPSEEPRDVLVVDHLGKETRDRLASGGRVLLVPSAGTVKGDRYGKVPPGFSSIFWNTAWTNRQPPHTLGILCDPVHPALAAFPTESHSNWQWWDLVARSQPMILDGLPPDVRPIVQIVDDWVTNRRLGLVFEARVGRGRLLVCSADIEKDLKHRPVARQMRASLLAYAASDKFQPRHEVSLAAIEAMFSPPSLFESLGVKASADSEQAGYEASQAIDGDPQTIWHTAWEPSPGPHPHHLTIEFQRELPIAALDYTPRQDMTNGRIGRFEIHVSRDGAAWGEAVASGQFAAGTATQRVAFAKPVSARFIRLTALSEVSGRPWAAIAELDLIPAPSLPPPKQ